LHWALYQFWPGAGPLGPWARDANFGEHLDLLIFRKNWYGSYATLNCLSSSANVIWGMMAGCLLRSSVEPRRKLRILLGWGAASGALGLALWPFVPLIKKIWTVSFAFHSAGYTLLLLALMYWLFDMRGVRRGTALPVAIGMNAIFIYLVGEIARGFLERGALVFTQWSAALDPATPLVLARLAACSIQLYLGWWLWRRRIFFKL